MNNIGKTPLIRAVNLEKILGVEKIYLKLEGNNPTRSKFDRIAEVIVKACKAKGKQAVIIDGNRRLLRAMNYISEIEKMVLLIPQHKKENWKEKIVGKEKLVDLSGVKKSDLQEVLRKLAIRNNAYLVNEDAYHQLSMLAIERIAEEVYLRYPGDIDSLFYQSDNQTSYFAYQNVFLKNHMINGGTIPEIYGAATSADLNYIDTSQMIVNDDLLKEAHELLQKHEHLKTKLNDVAPFAAFLKKIGEKKIQNGRHIVILDTARSRISIKQITDFSIITKAKLVDYVKNYLDRYSDSKTETIEAIDLAIENGYILVASREEDIAGVCVIVHMGFEEFIPTYHLAYIGINPKSKGRGLGSELIKEAINLTNGKISLHVDLDNKNAKKLYKKMGFEHVYDRMIYQRTEK